MHNWNNKRLVNALIFLFTRNSFTWVSSNYHYYLLFVKDQFYLVHKYFYHGYLGEFLGSVRIFCPKNFSKTTIIKLFTDQSEVSALLQGVVINGGDFQRFSKLFVKIYIRHATEYLKYSFWGTTWNNESTNPKPIKTEKKISFAPSDSYVQWSILR